MFESCTLWVKCADQDRREQTESRREGRLRIRQCRGRGANCLPLYWRKTRFFGLNLQPLIAKNSAPSPELANEIAIYSFIVSRL
jgi:hypothetical protein